MMMRVKQKMKGEETFLKECFFHQMQIKVKIISWFEINKKIIRFLFSILIIRITRGDQREKEKGVQEIRRIL